MASDVRDLKTGTWVGSIGSVSWGAIFAGAVAALTALSRVYVGAHLPADVVGGVGLGLAAGALTNAVRFSYATPSR